MAWRAGHARCFRDARRSAPARTCVRCGGRTTAAMDEVVLSEATWRSGFGGDPALLGRRIRLDGAPVVVVGIMPAGFRFPAPATIAWRPLDLASAHRGTAIVGRLAAGIPRADAEARTTAIARQLARLPRNYRGAPPLQAVGGPELSGFTRRALWLLLGGVTTVFVALCANVSSLLLTHLSARRREFGVCAALGASRGRLMRQATRNTCSLRSPALSRGRPAGASVARPQFFLGRTIRRHRRAGAAGRVRSQRDIRPLSGLVPAWLGAHRSGRALLASRRAGPETERPGSSPGLLVTESRSPVPARGSAPPPDRSCGWSRPSGLSLAGWMSGPRRPPPAFGDRRHGRALRRSKPASRLARSRPWPLAGVPEAERQRRVRRHGLRVTPAPAIGSAIATGSVPRSSASGIRCAAVCFSGDTEQDVIVGDGWRRSVAGLDPLGRAFAGRLARSDRSRGRIGCPRSSGSRSTRVLYAARPGIRTCISQHPLPGGLS